MNQTAPKVVGRWVKHLGNKLSTSEKNLLLEVSSQQKLSDGGSFQNALQDSPVIAMSPRLSQKCREKKESINMVDISFHNALQDSPIFAISPR